MSLRNLAAAVAVLALVAATTHGQNTSRISGEVKDTDGKPIAKATVTFTHVETNFAYKFTSDAKGRFFSSGLRLGGFKIRAEADGFMPFAGETKILPASSPDFALQLQRQAEAPADAKAAEEARKAFAAGDLIAAATHYEEFLALHEDDIETRWMFRAALSLARPHDLSPNVHDCRAR